MSIVTFFTFNAFEENTYVIYDKASSEAIVIDPGCHSPDEKEVLSSFLKKNNLILVAILNTHCHVDHVFGNAFLKKQFPEVPLCIHKGELPVLRAYPQFASMYGLAAEPSPTPDKFFADGDTFSFGNVNFEVCLTPGHSPASVSFYCRADSYIIGGDVLFRESIGRTDLPGGDYDTLIRSIEKHFFSLPDDVKVYCGHGPSTTIGHERKYNPFLKQS